MRMKLIKDLLAKENIDLATMDAFVGRGGIVRPLKSGVYTINENFLTIFTIAQCKPSCFRSRRNLCP